MTMSRTFTRPVSFITSRLREKTALTVLRWLRVAEKPRLTELKIRGNKKLAESKLRKKDLDKDQ